MKPIDEAWRRSGGTRDQRDCSRHAGGSRRGCRRRPRIEPLEGRALLNGALDPTFGDGGKAVVPFDPGGVDRGISVDVAVQPDGRIILAGTTSGPEGSRPSVVRLRADGALDPTFGDGGKVAVPFDLPGYADLAINAVAIQPDGRLVVAGHASKGMSNNGNDLDFAAVRLNGDGALDPTFGDGGKVAVPFDIGDPSSSQLDSASDVVIQPDGRIILAGTATYTTDLTRVAVARLGADGRLDPTFGDGGKAVVVHQDTFEDRASQAALQPDGRIVIAGSDSKHGSGSGLRGFAAFRLDPDGSPDASFGDSGKASVNFTPRSGTFPLDSSAEALALQPDGRILIAGDFGNDFVALPGPGSMVTLTYDFGVARLETNGALDPTFGDGGRALIPFNLGGLNIDRLSDLAFQPDGRFLLAGSADRSPTQSASSDFAIARLAPNGELDRSFGDGGRLVIPFDLGGTQSDRLDTMALQPDGRIVVAGIASTGEGAGETTAVARIEPGSPLLTVAEIGRVATPRLDPVTSIGVRFSAAIDPGSFTADDVRLTRDGEAMGLSEGLTIVPDSGDGLAFTVGGLDVYTVGEGRYRLTIDAAGILGTAGDSGFGSATVSFRVGSSPSSADYDGDRVDDRAIYTRDANGQAGRFEIALSSGGTMTREFGGPEDMPIVGDFDGDGKADIAVYGFSPMEGFSRFAYIRSSDGAAVRVAFGGRDDLPVAGDFDGDGVTDVAVHGFSPLDGAVRFAVRPSSDPGHAFPVAFGEAGDVPIGGDFDGDGVTDLAVYGSFPGGSSRFAIRPSSIPGQTDTVAFGGRDDLPVAGDFDGDGVTDVAVHGFSPLDGAVRFAVRPSSDPGHAFPVAFGGLVDEPIGIDPDGDGITDRVVYGFSPAEGVTRFAIVGSSDPAPQSVTMGTVGSVALPRPLRNSRAGGRVGGVRPTGAG